jgi:hypothetical protein
MVYPPPVFLRAGVFFFAAAFFFVVLFFAGLRFFAAGATVDVALAGRGATRIGCPPDSPYSRR